MIIRTVKLCGINTILDESGIRNSLAEFTDYKIVDEYLDTEDIVTTSTETMMIMNYDAEPDEYGILTTEYEVENTSTFSAENIVTRSIYSSELPTMIKFGTSDWDEHTDRSNSLLM